MIRHIVTWNFKEELTEEEKAVSKEKIKRELEGLKQLISEIVDIEVVIEPLASSTADVMLDSLFENEEHLNTYQQHPEHKRVGAYIKDVMTNRNCMDYVCKYFK